MALNRKVCRETVDALAQRGMIIMNTIKTHVEFDGDVVEVTFTVSSGLLWNTGGYLENGSYGCYEEAGEDAAAVNLLRALSERNDVYAAELFPVHIDEKNRAVCTMRLIPATDSDTDTVQRKVRIFALLLLLHVDSIDELENFQFKTTVVGEKRRQQTDMSAALAVNSFDPPTPVSGAWQA